MKWTTDANLRMATLIPRRHILAMSKETKIQFRALKQQVSSNYMSWQTGHWVPQRKKMSEVLRHMKSAGLIDYYISKYYDETYWSKRFEELSEPKVLSFDHLKVGFYLYLLLLIASFIVFIFEISLPWIKLLVTYVLVRFSLRTLRIRRLIQNV